MVMENYEEFYRRCVHRVNTEAPCSAELSHRRAQSAIHFHGRPVLQPKLSEEQRIEMAEQRQKAVEKESERRTLRTSSLLDRVQGILNRVQLKNVQAMVDAEVEQGAEASSPDLQALSSRRTHQEDQLPTGFIPSSSSSSSALRRKTLRLLNSRMEKVGKRGEERGEDEVEGEKTSTGTWPSHLRDIQRGSEDKAGVVDMQSQCSNRVEGQMESRNALHIRETDEENEICALESGNHFTSIESSCTIDTESTSSPLASLSLPASLMGSYFQLPSLQQSGSPPTHRLRKPCLSTAGSILISLPISELELNKTNTVHCESHVLENSSNGMTKSEEPGEYWNHSFSQLSSKKLFSVSTSTPSSSASITPRRPVTLSHTPSPTQPGPAPHRERDRQSHSSPYQRTPPAPLNQSYDVESPSPSLLRPEVSSGPELFTEPVRRRLELGQCPQHPTKDSMCETPKFQDKAVGEVRQQSQVLEALHQCLEEDHAHQLSHQLKTQARETQRLQQNPEIQRKQVDSSVSSGRPRSTQQLHTQMKVLSAEQHKAVFYLTAVGRGFLTRRLLQTEKIKHLCKTIQDSRELICSFQTDTKQRRASFTPQDLSLQHRVRAQLRAALCNLHEIFFVWPARNRLALLQQDRELCNERRMREMEKAMSPQDRPSLSSATQKSLNRKKQRQGKKIPQKPKDPSARVLQPVQRQNALSISQKLQPVRAVRRTVENHRSYLSLG